MTAVASGYRPVFDPFDPVDPYAPRGFYGASNGGRPAVRPPTPVPASTARPVVPAAPSPRYFRVGRAVGFGEVTRGPVPMYETRVRLMPGCFDVYLADVARGRAAVRLLVDHDDRRELAGTWGRSLDVWADREAVWVAVTTAEAAGRIQSLSHLRHLSIGFTPLSSRPGRDDAGPLVDVFTAMLAEVSLVAEGNFPRTFFA